MGECCLDVGPLDSLEDEMKWPFGPMQFIGDGEERTDWFAGPRGASDADWEFSILRCGARDSVSFSLEIENEPGAARVVDGPVPMTHVGHLHRVLRFESPGRLRFHIKWHARSGVRISGVLATRAEPT